MKIETTNIQTSTYLRKANENTPATQPNEDIKKNKSTQQSDDEDKKRDATSPLVKGDKKTKPLKTFTKGERKIKVHHGSSVEDRPPVEVTHDNVSLTPAAKLIQKTTAGGVTESKKSNIDDVIKEVVNNKKSYEKVIIANKRDYDYYINENEDLSIKVIDKTSGDIIKEIPPKEQQKLTKAIHDSIERQFSANT